MGEERPEEEAKISEMLICTKKNEVSKLQLIAAQNPSHSTMLQALFRFLPTGSITTPDVYYVLLSGGEQGYSMGTNLV